MHTAWEANFTSLEIRSNTPYLTQASSVICLCLFKYPPELPISIVAQLVGDDLPEPTRNSSSQSLCSFNSDYYGLAFY